MPLAKKILAFVGLTTVLFCLASVPVRSQGVPAADHHAHLQSPTAAQLLNEGAVRKSHAPTQDEAEKPSTAAELIAQLDAAGIVRSVALSDAYRLGSPFVHVPYEAAAVDAENDWTLRQVQLYADRLVGFCSVNPVRPYARAAIGHCAHIGLRGGLKLHLANAEFRFDDPSQVLQLREVFAEADRLRMPILIHLRADEVWDARRNVRVFVDTILPAASHVPVQVAHLGGWGGYDRTSDEILSAFADECEKTPDPCRHLYFDIAAVVLSARDAAAAPGSDARQLWDEQKDFADGPSLLATNLRRIGLSRIVFGTDWPVATATDYVAALRENLLLSPAEIQQIFSNLAPYFPRGHRSR